MSFLNAFFGGRWIEVEGSSKGDLNLRKSSVAFLYQLKLVPQVAIYSKQSLGVCLRALSQSQVNIN